MCERRKERTSECQIKRDLMESGDNKRSDARVCCGLPPITTGLLSFSSSDMSSMLVAKNSSGWQENMQRRLSVLSKRHKLAYAAAATYLIVARKALLLRLAKLHEGNSGTKGPRTRRLHGEPRLHEKRLRSGDEEKHGSKDLHIL